MVNLNVEWINDGNDYTKIKKKKLQGPLQIHRSSYAISINIIKIAEFMLNINTFQTLTCFVPLATTSYVNTFMYSIALKCLPIVNKCDAIRNLMNV